MGTFVRLRSPSLPVCQSVPTQLYPTSHGAPLTSVVFFKVRACLEAADPKISASPRPWAPSPPTLSTHTIERAKVYPSVSYLKSLGTLSESLAP